MRYLTYLLLLVAAVILARIFFPIGILFTTYRAIRMWLLGKAWGYVSNSALTIATSIDLMGNVVCRDLIELTLTKPDGYKFGRPTETISRVLGKNKAQGTLTDAGRGPANLLNWIEPNHVEGAAKD
jgi:hypothetical protein